MKPPLMLNMIVRNESARIERCLTSVLPYVKSVAILDTGSTDDTPEIITRICHDAGIPYAIKRSEFIDFSQARNEAFAFAKSFNKANTAWCQFALLVDADMELKADTDAFAELNASAASYDMMQTGGSVTYGNRRLINMNAKDNPYVGVTHEYLDLPAAGLISGASFVDHADGFNRKDKYVRDAALLNKALETDPHNGRYLYYLGNTYRDAGQALLAIDAYEKRIALGGWDEETHSAMMHLAGCHLATGDEAKFVHTMTAAYDFRPSRAEPLHDLAKHYREKGKNAAALVYAKAGVNIKVPNDLLFVNTYVYNHGLRYEYSITGFYDPTERARSFEITDDLALDPTCPEEIRRSARSNLYWHLKPLIEHCPSFVGKRLDFTPPAGYTAMNPSVAIHGDHLLCNIRCVNYKIDNDGRYMIGPKECGDAPIDTRNFVVQLDRKLTPVMPAEVLWVRPAPAWDMVTGLEDIRLHSDGVGLRFTACARELNAGGMPQMITGGLDYAYPNHMEVNAWRAISDGHACEKNWMPVLVREGWLYNCTTYLTPALHRPTEITARLHTNDLRGSSQAVPWKKGYVAVLHEAGTDPQGKRTYWHRFAWFDHDMALHRVSKPFVFYDRQIEFCAGLAIRGTDFVISFGVRDAEAHIATVDQTEVSRMLALYWT